MPYGYPATNVEWVTLSSGEGQSDPIPGDAISLTEHDDPVTGGRVVIMKGMSGFDAPPIEMFYDEMSGLDGGLFRHSRVTTRELFIPLIMWATSRQDFLTLKRDLLSRMSPASGLGRLKLTEGDNTSRYIDCRYTGGAEGTYTEDEGGFFWQKYGLTFRALDPFWYDVSPQQVNWTAEAAELKSFFGDGSEPFFGIRLNPSRGINSTTPVTSLGDYYTWPTWTIQGPLEGLTVAVSGASTGSFTLDVSLGTGEVLHVDTRPSRRRIIKLDEPPIVVGQNFWSVLESGDQFWPLSKGLNEITLTAGSVGPGTSISMNYRPRYYSA